ncbi:MAG: hypothetical protein AB1485_04390 [Candidatus Thermoplasmatota archaeon]
MKKAQIHIIEIALGALIFIVAIIFIGSIKVPQIQQSYSQLYLATLGSDALRSFDLMPLPDITNASKYHNSNITYELFGSGKWHETGNVSVLLNFLDKALPKDVSYNLYLRNSTMQTTINFSATPGLNSISVCRTIVFNGTVYELVLLLWHEPR